MGFMALLGGLVILFSSINTTMATAVQRFMNFEMGKRNEEKLNTVFNTSVIIHIGIAVVIFLILETLGVWFLNNEMNISPERMNAANWVLQFSIFAFVVSVLSVPYNAAIIANERMKAFAYFGILEVFLKLLIVFMLNWFSFDKLKLYAVLMFVLSVIFRIIYGVYAKKNFKECSFHWEWDKGLFKEMTAFAGWNLIGVSSTLIRTQGNNIVLNIFFGAFVNAAMTIANTVKNAVEQFTGNFLVAISPQITKSYASEDRNYFLNLVYKGSKYAFYMLLFITLPLILESEFILKLWLKIVPEYAVIFVKLILFTALIESLSKLLIQAMFATGNIRNYQIIVGSITLMNLPLSILFLYWGYPPQVTLTIGIAIAIISLFVRIFMLNKMIGLSIREFSTNVLIKALNVSAIAVVLPLVLLYSLSSGMYRFLLVGLACAISVSLSVFFVGLTSSERILVKRKVIHQLKKILK